MCDRRLNRWNFGVDTWVGFGYDSDSEKGSLVGFGYRDPESSIGSDIGFDMVSNC